MGRPPKKTLGQQVAKARVAVLNADVVRLMDEFASTRGIASKDAREEAKEIRTRLLPQIVSVQAEMIMQHIAIDPAWCKLVEDFLDRAEGKAAQSLVHSGGIDSRITTVEVHQPCR